MEESIETQDLKEILSEDANCNNGNFNLTDDRKSLDFNFDTSNSNDSSLKLNASKESNENEQLNDEDNLFDTDMDLFDSNDFMKSGSPLSENLELEKIMEQLSDTIQGNTFAAGNISENQLDEEENILNEDSLKENDTDLENIDELNLLNNDIISYINSDSDKDKSDLFLNDENSKTDNSPLGNFFPRSEEIGQNEIGDEPSKEKDIIDLINKELEDTLQFTNVLCHYIYSDVIIGKDFFNLLCGENVKSDTEAVSDAVEKI